SVSGRNCTVTGLGIALKPLADRFGLRSVIMTSMQGLSGAGRSPGVIALDILDNIIPYIPKEEEKVEKELHKIFGTLTGSVIRDHPAVVSATCTRANVAEGHTEAGVREPGPQGDPGRGAGGVARIPQRGVPDGAAVDARRVHSRSRRSLSPAAEVRPQPRQRHDHHRRPPPRGPCARQR